MVGFGGATTGGSNLGVFVTGAGTQITSGGARFPSRDKGAAAARANNYGVDIQSAGQITSGGSGTIAVQGTGGRPRGVSTFACSSPTPVRKLLLAAAA